MGETVPPPPPPQKNHFLSPLEAAGTSGAQKCRGSGAPKPNQHPNHPLCYAVCAAAIFFEVVEKACAMATNFLKFCSMGSTNGVAFVVGALGVLCWDWDAGSAFTWSMEVATGSGLLVA